MKVAFHLETLEAASLFRERLTELSKKVDLGAIRLYKISGHKIPEISDEIYAEADEVFAIRENAISKEMRAHGVAQAQIAGITLPEDIVNGTNMNIGQPSLYEQVPTAKVYELFMPYTLSSLH